MELFGRVIGKEDFTMTDLRKAAEGKIQSDKNLAAVTQDLNNHSSQVVQDYDNMGAARRNMFISSRGAEEGSSSNITSEEFKKIYDERQKQEEENLTKMREEAKAFLDNKKKKEIVDFTPSCIEQADIEFLKEIFPIEDIRGKKVFLHIKII